MQCGHDRCAISRHRPKTVSAEAHRRPLSEHQLSCLDLQAIDPLWIGLAQLVQKTQCISTKFLTGPGTDIERRASAQDDLGICKSEDATTSLQVLATTHFQARNRVCRHLVYPGSTPRLRHGSRGGASANMESCGCNVMYMLVRPVRQERLDCAIAHNSRW